MALSPPCASCTVAAAAANILTYPSPIAHFVNIVTTTHLNVVDGSTTTSFASATVTTLADSTPAGGVVTSVYGNPTWEVSGAVLAYPNTYIQYQGFEGAAATASDQCAQTLSPTPLSLPNNVNQASLIYPSAGTALPGALLSYLDSLGLQSQLGGDQLTGCGIDRQAPFQGPIASSGFGNTTTTVTTSPSTAAISTTASPTVSTTASASVPPPGSSSAPSSAPSSTPSTVLSPSATSSNGSSASSASAEPVSSPTTSSTLGETFTITSVSTSTGTTIVTSSVVNTSPIVISSVTPPVTTTSPPFLPITATSTIETAKTATSVVIFSSLSGPTIITSSGSTMTQTPQSDMLPSSAAPSSFAGFASVLESILMHKPTATSSGSSSSMSSLPLMSSVSLPGPLGTLSAVTTVAGNPIYTNSNGSSYTLATATGTGTINGTNATMTSATIVPYTGAASKDQSMQNVQWLGGLLSLLMPFLL